MKTTMLKSAGVLLLGILMVTAVNAQPPRDGRGSGNRYGDGSGKFAAMNLTEEQQEEITTLRTAHYKVMNPLKNKMTELKARERTLMSEETVDIKAVNKTIDEQTSLLNEMKKEQATHQIKVKSLLSDEQVMQLQQGRKFAQGKGYHQGRRGNGAGQRSNRMGRGGQGTGRGYRSM